MDEDVAREIERLTEIEISKLSRAQAAQTAQSKINAANERQKELQNANQ